MLIYIFVSFQNAAISHYKVVNTLQCNNCQIKLCLWNKLSKMKFKHENVLILSKLTNWHPTLKCCKTTDNGLSCFAHRQNVVVK